MNKNRINSAPMSILFQPFGVCFFHFPISLPFATSATGGLNLNLSGWLNRTNLNWTEPSRAELNWGEVCPVGLLEMRGHERLSFGFSRGGRKRKALSLDKAARKLQSGLGLGFSPGHCTLPSGAYCTCTCATRTWPKMSLAMVDVVAPGSYISIHFPFSIAISTFYCLCFLGKLINRRNSIWKVAWAGQAGDPLKSDNTNRQLPTTEQPTTKQRTTRNEQPAVSDKSNKRVTVERA